MTQILGETKSNETTIRQADLKEFESDLDYLVNLTAAVESANEALSERAKELQDKYNEHPTFCFKSAQLKRMAKIVLKDNLESERDKANTIFDMLEAIMEDGE